MAAGICAGVGAPCSCPQVSVNMLPEMRSDIIPFAFQTPCIQNTVLTLCANRRGALSFSVKKERTLQASEIIRKYGPKT